MKSISKGNGSLITQNCLKAMNFKADKFDFEKLNRLGMILVLSGASGTGKSTICKRVLKENNLHFSVSCNTRKPRPGEVHGKDYYFISVDEFKNKIKNDEFIEYANVHGNYNGTLKSEVMDIIASGEDVLLDVDVQGAMTIKKAAAQDPILKRCTEFIFIAPPTFSELEKRLRGRATDSEEVIKRRLNNAKEELSKFFEYEYLIINKNLETAIKELNSVIIALKTKTKRIEI